jgi:hypothetical protein
VLEDVLDVHLAQGIGDGAFARGLAIVEVTPDRVDVALALLEVADGGLCNGQRLEDFPEELHVRVTARMLGSAVVERRSVEGF